MSNVVQLPTSGRPARPVSDQKTPASVTAFVAPALTPRQERRQGKPEFPPPATESAKNSRIRNARRDAWWRAERLVDYWRARFDWYSALGTAQKWEIAGSASFSPAKEHLARLELVDKWREAIAKKLLTPAPCIAAVTWKQAQLRTLGFSYVPVKKEQVERAIADDVAFLAAHPTRAKRGTP